MSVVIQNGSISFNFDLREFVEALSDEEKNELIGYLTWDSVLEEAIKRLTGETENWGSDDEKLTLDVLSKMESSLLSGYKWNMLKDLNTLSKNLISHEHIYWKMWHDPVNGPFFQQWLRDNNIESNYTHELPNYTEFKKMVENTLSEFAEKI